MTAFATDRLERLRAVLAEIGSCAVAFSAGVDSTFLLHVAHEILGDRAVAVTVRSRVLSRADGAEAVAFCAAEGIRHVIIDVDELAIPGFAENPPDRCYHCKRSLFMRLLDFARENGLAAVVEGSNVDDDGDYRPGHRALRELAIRSPLREAGLTKRDIRALSREMGLPTWNKPSAACLASRFPYGERITAEGLGMVERAESFLRGLFPDLAQLRVRVHGGVARIEVPPADFGRIVGRGAEIAGGLKSIGFPYSALDLVGYRTGSLNETLR